MTGKEIVERAESFKGYKYWYGGKREVASVALANRLKKENPNVWTDTYYNTALKDIDGITRVCDCSGLVCACYGISDIGSYAIREKYKVWNGSPKPGMIAWKQGHVAIIKDYDGHVIEMRSQAYDYQDTRYRKEAGLNTLLYDPNINYDVTDNKDGWEKDNNGWKYKENGAYIKGAFKNINGHNYCFDNEGYINYIMRVNPTDDRGWI